MTNPVFRLIDTTTNLEVGRYRSKKIALADFNGDLNRRRRMFGQPELKLRLETRHSRMGWMEYVARS